MWKYFSYIDSHFAICDICKIKISHKTTMSNLKKTYREKTSFNTFRYGIR